MKNGIKATLVALGDQYQSSWMRCLPWVVLGRRTSFHGELQATPAQAVFGEDPKLPGDMAPPLASGETVTEILDRVKANASRPPAQTAPHKVLPVYMPPTTATATHVWTKKPKKSPLGPINDGPLPILKRLGKSCLLLQVGTRANGQPRTEVRHWKTCFPADMPEGTSPQFKPGPGRKRNSENSGRNR